MESASCRTVAILGSQPNTNFALLKKPSTQDFLSELRSYPCAYWKWRPKLRIREVFVVGDIANPDAGGIDKVCIKRKTRDFIELADSTRFDIETGRSLYGEPKYIFPVWDRRVSDAWEPQSLRHRVECAMLRLPFALVQEYADMLNPEWRRMFEWLGLHSVFGRFTHRSALSLSESEQGSMAEDRKSAKRRILDHLPTVIVELRAFVEMMEGDAK